LRTDYVANVAALWKLETPLHLHVFVSGREGSHFLERDIRAPNEDL
jgi:hypothetical protein